MEIDYVGVSPEYGMWDIGTREVNEPYYPEYNKLGVEDAIAGNIKYRQIWWYKLNQDIPDNAINIRFYFNRYSVSEIEHAETSGTREITASCINIGPVEFSIKSNKSKFELIKDASTTLIDSRPLSPEYAGITLCYNTGLLYNISIVEKQWIGVAFTVDERLTPGIDDTCKLEVNYYKYQGSSYHPVIYYDLPTTTITPTSKHIDSHSGSYTIDVTSNTSWTVSDVPHWASAASTPGGGNGSITITYRSNESTSSRSAVIKIGDKTHTITQAGKAPSTSISPTSMTIAASGDGYHIIVTSNVDWAVRGLPDWAFAQLASGSGNGQVWISAYPNNSTDSRSATFTIGGKSHTITQSGTTPSTNITPTTKSVGNGDGSYTLSVASNTSWQVSGSYNWVRANINAGSGNSSITITYDPNNSTDSRSATFTIGGKSHTITQSGKEESNPLLFKEDFKDLKSWTTWGHPSPYIDYEIGNPAPSFCNNGDSSWDSGITSIAIFDYSTGLTIEANAYQIEFDTWESFVFGLSSVPSYGNNEGVKPSVWIRSKHDNGDITQCGLYYSASDTEVFETYDADTSWRIYRIVILPDRRVKFYKGDQMIYSSTHTLSLGFNHMPLVVGGRASSTVLVDNIEVYSGEPKSITPTLGIANKRTSIPIPIPLKWSKLFK
ncbi:BACON domain-containing protein [Ruficoccus sp. ZRK36]|uniref:BACON domain-containing protein n=1 Tax=Ruficoccus sp. ZRK36 TaxID=2866311 RepID=UPI001C73162C|nr:BACON domain-containing protein [Ruficoccus sp. ZRK36]QYY35351.1 BACON domain-containing protein [Ruficoccus sp. ZRK36]